MKYLSSKKFSVVKECVVLSVMAFLRSICYRAPNLVCNSLRTRELPVVLSRASSSSSPSSSSPESSGNKLFVGESSVNQRSQLKGNLLKRNASTTAAPQRDPLDVGFNDPNAAFKSKTTFELIRAYLVYLMCSSETLVENNMKVRFSLPMLGIPKLRNLSRSP